MKKTINKITSFALAFAMMLTLMPSMVFAANASDLSDNMTRQKAGEAADHVIQFDLPTALANGEEIVITFPNGAGEFTGTAAPTGAGWAAGPGANQITYTSTGDAADTTYNVSVSGLTNPTTVANHVIDITADNGDTGEITVPIIADDQIHITAKVAQTLTFDVLDGTADSATDNAVQFGTLTSGAARYATDAGTGSASPVASSELQAGTNASGGYIIDVTGETLSSGTDNIDGLFTAAASAPGTEQFGINVTQTQASTGATSGTIAADYATNYHLPDSATTDLLVTNTGPSSEEIYDVTYLANISALTPAGNYSTVLTYTMTANF